ncbi:hypothetical protein FSARC_13842 [Fusarium sarcochroum]|uniref:Ubiquitin-like protease family profile domain-containing protein n=1 Tax=Fusarium sarcochroum TaxID=1208366 RepID=A0A8H4WSA9_9HYPO|nr:hypothetical protein FSARC_13842 [Fusarium sarcochroum]
MSRKNNRSTGGPTPLDKVNHIDIARPEEGTCTSDLSVSEEESASQSLLRLLRLPLTLEYILKNQLEGEKLSQEMRTAVSQRTVTEQQRLRSFAQSLHRTCDDVLGRASFLDNDKTDTSCEPANQQRDLDDTNDTEEHENNNVSKQADIQHDDSSDPRSPCSRVTHAKEGRGESSDAFCTASFRPSTPVRSGKDSAKVSSKSAARPLPMASSPEVEPSIEPMTPERTPPRASSASLAFPTPKDTSNSGCLYLLGQDIDDFIGDSYRDVQLFHLLENDLGTYKAILDSLTKQAEHMNREERDKVLWSDGSQWASLLGAGNKFRRQGTLCYALTAVAFARWHASQVQLVNNPTTPQEAAQEVSERILRSRLGPRDENSRKDWERGRKSLNTHLTRGRKWSRLVEELGSGILFKNAWKLAKSSQQELDILCRDLPKDKTKTTVLRLLADQMVILLQTGKTNPGVFREHLETDGPSSLRISSPHKHGRRNDGIYTRVLGRIVSDRVHIRGTDFEFDIGSLRSITGDEWLNDQVILACLHLCDKHSFIRVGFCIPVHRQTKSGIVPRPFEMAKKQLESWHKSNEELVGLFPLLLHNNHFSLLEINEREKCAFHYDSQWRSRHDDIKKAFEKEFPNFQFIDKVGGLDVGREDPGSEDCTMIDLTVDE